ncbi:hypothetical protein ACLESO_22405, partial [Pyxidicoccus sp. 3LG]
MKWRIASVAFLLGSLSTGLTWLSLQPALIRLLDMARRLAPPDSAEAEALARVKGLLPLGARAGPGGAHGARVRGAGPDGGPARCANTEAVVEQ